ncbi:MAG: hypothetical protein DYG98_25505 [Haliscomenobacteraceae bacterium CHB4]|nr:hypothetical protein [Saprospiraceae bacterium]MCE7926416.1 hypothetical protein [Haliscomenobacteraceae bacterium CHB4]
MPLYALLIAINEYHPDSEVRSLAGCLNDAAAIRQFLLEHFADQIPDEKAHIRLLANEQATRAKLIAAFREHLCRAGPGDVVFVYYSGHGSQSATAVEFQRFVPDDREEGWVLYDSRLPGRYDLADKEIALLLEEVGRRNPEIVVAADSCHSGSVTRSTEDFLGWNPRFIPGTGAPRPLDTYLDGAYQKRLAEQGILAVPATRHLLFSACDNKEVAWETREKCGVFTKALLEVLRDTAGRTRYADLYTRVCAAIRVQSRQQHPQAEAFGGFNPRSGFLGKSVPAGLRQRYALFFNKENQSWRIKLGAADGIRTDTNKAIPLGIYDAETNGHESGQASLSFIGATESGVAFGGDAVPDPSQTWWAEPLGVPLAPFVVYCPDRPAVGAVVEALGRSKETAILFSDTPDGCAVELRSENGNLALFHTGRNALIHGVEGTTEAAAAYMLEILDHLAHWHRIQDLHNPRTALPENAVALSMEVQHGGAWTALPGESVTLSFSGARINFRLLASNEAARPLYMALVYLNPRFQMSVLWHSTTAVPSGKTRLTIFEDFLHLPTGSDEEIDTLKLVVSTEPIEQTAFSRPELLPQIVGPTRSIGAATYSGDLSHPDWLAKTLRIRLLRDSSDGSVGEQPLTLAGGQVVIGAHPVFRSAFALAAQAATRGLDALQLDRAFFQQNPVVDWLALGDTRGAEMPFLDLTGITAAKEIARQPLEINLMPREPGAVILPFWFDGENFLPAGEAVVRPGGALQVRVRNIPEETQAARTRSLGKALRLYFFKFAKDRRLPPHTQYLKWVDYGAGNPPERKTGGMSDRIAGARKIFLLIHGIAGDTGCMTEAFRPLAAEPHTLVLTFDYENLDTPIGDTALALKTKLAAAGIGPGDGKELTLVAHSMGGLVARYFIEQLEGHQFADKLVMTGTPNAGSEPGNAADHLNWAYAVMGLGMRYFSPNLPALAGFIGALQLAGDNLFVTLEQMQKGSGFLGRLAGKTRPPLSYHVIAGDISAFLEKEHDPEFMLRVLKQTGRSCCGTEPNDGAVSVESICAVPGATRELVAEHHCGYYRTEFRVV